MRERFLHRRREQLCAIRAYDMSAVGIDVVSVHKLFAYRVMSTVRIDVGSGHMKFCRIAYGITRKQNALQNANERMISDFMAF